MSIEGPKGAKYKIFQLPNGEWRLSMMAGIDATSGDALWIKASQTDFIGFEAAKVGLERLINVVSHLFDENGHPI